ncbi:MAG: peptidoglycan DD-metalloendopeptidase family protein [Pseudomonadota bacterium]
MIRAVWLLILAISPAIAGAQSALKEQELVKVRAEIRALTVELEKKTRARTKLHDELGRAESALASARERLAETDQEIVAARQRLAEVEANEAQRRQELSQERKFLAGQMRAAYVSGRSERLRLILNQQDPAEVGRRTTYYGYLNRFRQANIDTVRDKLAELAVLRAKTEASRQQLAEVRERRRRQLAEQEATLAERAQLLARLDSEIASQGGAVEDLKARERDLDRLVQELNGILEDYPISAEKPFAQLRGQLTWPVAGRLLNDYGQPRDGSELRWNGVLLEAERGSEVRAIYHGRVAYAEWLPRLGLLLVIDHGDGYLSLYGHNDTLYRRVGDWVGAGDVIGAVGDSGGQSRPALYLELRKGKQPLNPNRWISRRPRGR